MGRISKKEIKEAKKDGKDFFNSALKRNLSKLDQARLNANESCDEAFNSKALKEYCKSGVYSKYLE